MHPVDELWCSLCDAYAGIEVAWRHALEESELQPEDLLSIGAVAALRDSYRTCAAMVDLPVDDERFLAEIDRRLSSLEGRVEIIGLAVG